MSMRTTEIRVAFHALIRLERSLSFGGGRGECWQRGGGQVAGELSVGALLCWLFAGLGGGKDGGELVLGDLRLREVIRLNEIT